MTRSHFSYRGGVEAFTPTLIATIAAGVFLALAVVGTVAIASSIVARALPSRVLGAVEALSDRVVEVERASATLQADWAQTIENLDAFSDTIERKRKQVQGAIGRLERLNGQGAESAPQSVEDQLVALQQATYGRPNS